MKKVFLSICCALIASTVAINSYAGDVEAGKAKSAVCAACHGADGISPNDLWPSLAGQKEGYLAKQIKDFRDGKRQDPMMAPMVASLTDQDAEDLAAFYAGL